MRSLKSDKGWKRVLYSKVTAGLLILFIFFMFSVVWSMYGSYRETQEKMLASAAQLEQAQSRKADLEKRVQTLKTESGVEAELRRKFLIAEEGENVMVVVDDEEEKKETQPLPEEKSLWEKFLSLF